MRRPLLLYFMSSVMLFASNLALIAVAPVSLLPFYTMCIGTAYNVFLFALIVFKNTHPAFKLLLTTLMSLCWFMRYIALHRLACAHYPLPPSLSHLHPLPPLRVRTGASS